MKKVNINLYEGCSYHAELSMEDGKGQLQYFYKGKQFDDEYMENFNPDVFTITKRLAEFICFENDCILMSY